MIHTLIARCKQGEHIAIIGKYLAGRSRYFGSGILHARGHHRSSLLTLRVDTIIHVSPAPDWVLSECARMLWLSRHPVMIYLERDTDYLRRNLTYYLERGIE